MQRHLRRLERVWIDSPIYFVTTCTKDRHAVLARDDITNVLIQEWSAARDRHGWIVGRYVVMPDHVHFFCRPEYEAKPLSEFVASWKRWTSRTINKLLRPRSATTIQSRFGSGNSLTTFCAWSLRRRTGITQAKSKL